MEGNYGVYLGNNLCGKVQILRQGLYYRFICRCQISGDILCRLKFTCGTCQEDLGIVVPIAGAFGVDTRIPIKRIGEGKPVFSLHPNRETARTKFIPIVPEEPFAYISRLKNAYLVRRNGQAGIWIE